MNYYPFHAGDYAAHTSHLTWEEDIAYRRMLDIYYLHERALPADTGKVARLIRMTDNMDAVLVVLEEFFELSDDGWHNKRADAELDNMAAKQEQQQAKDAHESERMRRHRARRAEMFAELRAQGIVPAWDIPIKELQRLFNATSNGPATYLQREQVLPVTATCNADATAIPTPTPTPTPNIEDKKTARVARSAQARAAPSRPDEISESVWQDFLAMRKAKRAPLNDTALDGIRREAAKAGIGLGEAIAACCEFGWQGFNAGWYAERRNSKTAGETTYQRSMRERAQEFSPEIARQAPDYSKTFVQEVQDVVAITGH